MTMEKLTLYSVCPVCGKQTRVTVNCTEKEYQDYLWHYKWYRKKPIQDIFPDATPYTRERIKSGFCSSCMKKYYRFK